MRRRDTQIVGAGSEETYLESMAGQIIALFVIAIAAGEAAVGLAIIIVVFRGKISTNVDEMNLLKW